MKYIDADKLIAELKGFRNIARERIDDEDCYFLGMAQGYDNAIDIITSLQQEQPEVDYLRNKAELIANEIMMGVQANKYHTCIYDKSSNDFNHSHLLRAALKGIEVGLNARKEDTK